MRDAERFEQRERAVHLLERIEVVRRETYQTGTGVADHTAGAQRSDRRRGIGMLERDDRRALAGIARAADVPALFEGAVD